MSPLGRGRGTRNRWSLADRLGIALIVGAVLVGLWWSAGSPRTLPKSVADFATTVRTRVEEPQGDPLPPMAPVSPGDLGEPPEPRQNYPHIELQDGVDLEKAVHKFRYEGEKYSVAVRVDPQLYWGAAGERLISVRDGESEDERTAAFYRYMVQDPLQAPLISEVSKKLRKIAKREGFGRDRYAEFISKYVQTMPYDYEKLDAEDGSARFPVQTLVDGTGVCGDKSLLLAALLAHEGYDVALLAFEAEEHMAVGIKGPGDKYGESGYLFVESTAPAYISEVPENYVSGIRLTSDALVIPIGEGSAKYGSAKDVARIIAVRSTTKEAAEQLIDEASRMVMTQAQANSVNARLHQSNESQLKLQSVTGEEHQFLDRGPALRWIEKNCWWD
ncbi:MAG TPA: transglutaminase-like domain-containing protein [Coriobacteriia bacterium]|nr:transglutaminase-like domain-containing protein [Coriobacteriia bacterium]